MLYLTHPPFSLYYLNFIAFIPLFHYFFIKKGPLKPVYTSFVIYYFLTFTWMLGSADLFPIIYLGVPLLVLVVPVFYMFALYACRYFTARRSRFIQYLCLLFLLPGAEWMKSHGELACPFGNPLINLVESPLFRDNFSFPGLWWFYFLVLLFNFLLFELLLCLLKRKKSFYIPAVAGAGIFIFLLFGSDLFLSPLEPEDTAPLEMVIIQPNTPLEIKWDPYMNDYMVEEQIRLAREYTEEEDEHASAGSLFLIPETSFFNTDLEDVHSIPEKLIEFSREKEWYLLGGAMMRLIEEGELNFYNSALFYDPFQNRKDHYHKLQPVPFVESFPWSHHFPFLQDIYQFIAAFDRGERHAIFDVEGVNIAPLICFESTLFGLTSEFRSHNADLLITLTNNSWFDHTAGLPQHFLFAKAQALKHRTPFVQVANSGITAIISESGEVLSEVPPYKDTVLTGRLEVPIGTYNQTGKPPAFLFPISVILALGGILWKKLKYILLKSSKKKS